MKLKKILSISFGAVIIPEEHCKILAFEESRCCVLFYTFNRPNKYCFCASYNIFGIECRVMRLNDLVKNG